LLAPYLPFFSDYLNAALHQGLRPEEMAAQKDLVSVHERLYSVPAALGASQRALVEEMALAQRAILLGRSLRAEVKIGMRQPLQKISVAGLSGEEQKLLKSLEEMVLSELNLKEIQFLKDGTALVVETVKPNLKRLGSKLGKKMPVVTGALRAWGPKEIAAFEKAGFAVIAEERLEKDDILIERKAAEGKAAGALDGLVAELDTTLTPALKREGLMRELVNRIQQKRKEKKFQLTDRIRVRFAAGGLCAEIAEAEMKAPSFLSEETLTKKWESASNLGDPEKFEDHGDAWIAFDLDQA
jgi:isoleucyl-tRNA synthetase